MKDDIVIHDISYSSNVGGAYMVLHVSTTDIKAASTFTQDLSATQLLRKYIMMVGVKSGRMNIHSRLRAY